MRNLSIGGVIGRFLASLILVLATFNPTGYSFVGWIAGHFPHLEPLQLVLGIALLALWLFFCTPPGDPWERWAWSWASRSLRR
jgi:hypothetical protein